MQTSSAASPFLFQVDYALLQGGIAVGDTIEFFAAVEDSNGTIGSGAVNINGVVMFI